jgi:hypothetical protein
VARPGAPGARPSRAAGAPGRARAGGELPVGDRLGDRPPVGPARRARRRRRVQLGAAAGGLGGQVVDQGTRASAEGAASAGTRVDTSRIRSACSHDESCWATRRSASSITSPGRAPARPGSGATEGRPAGGSRRRGLGAASRPGALGVGDLRLLRAALHHGVPLQGGERAGVGFGAVVVVDPAAQHLGQAGLDLLGALRELLAQPLGHVDQVGLAALELTPGQPEAGGELRPEGGVVEPADGALLSLQQVSVEGEPRPVVSCTLAHTRRGCGAAGRRCGLVCWRNRATVSPWVSTWWTPSVPRRRRRRARKPGQGGVTAVSCAARTSARTHGSSGQPPQEAHRLRCREGRVVASEPTAPRSRDPASGR